MPDLAFLTLDDNTTYTVTDSGTVLTLTHISTGTGGDTSKLVSIEIKSSTTEISNDCFNAYTNLTTVTFESSPNITTLGDNAFRECSSLNSVTIPNSVTSIGDNVFRDCSNLDSIRA